MKGWVAVLLASVVLALSPVLQSPASATSSWPKLMLSRTGTHWSTDLTTPMFGPARRWVPGDDQTRTFYARNQSGEDARLRVSFLVHDPTAWLGTGRLRMSVRTNGTWTRLRFSGRTGVVHMLARRGQVVPVHVRIRLLSDAGNQSMGRSMGFDVSVRLTELASWKRASA